MTFKLKKQTSIPEIVCDRVRNVPKILSTARHMYFLILCFGSFLPLFPTSEKILTWFSCCRITCLIDSLYGAEKMSMEVMRYEIQKNVNPLSANPTKLSNTIKQFVGCCRQIVWVCLSILWNWRLKG